MLPIIGIFITYHLPDMILGLVSTIISLLLFGSIIFVTLAGHDMKTKYKPTNVL